MSGIRIPRRAFLTAIAVAPLSAATSDDAFRLYRYRAEADDGTALDGAAPFTSPPYRVGDEVYEGGQRFVVRSVG